MAYPEELGMLRPAEGQKLVPKVDPKEAQAKFINLI